MAVLITVGHHSRSDVCVKETECCPSSLTRLVNDDVRVVPRLGILAVQVVQQAERSRLDVDHEERVV